MIYVYIYIYIAYFIELARLRFNHATPRVIRVTRVTRIIRITRAIISVSMIYYTKQYSWSRFRDNPI